MQMFPPKYRQSLKLLPFEKQTTLLASLEGLSSVVVGLSISEAAATITLSRCQLCHIAMGG